MNIFFLTGGPGAPACCDSVSIGLSSKSYSHSVATLRCADLIQGLAETTSDYNRNKGHPILAAALGVAPHESDGQQDEAGQA